jgi:hypothetical protein
VVKKKQKQPLSLDTFVWKATGPGSDMPTMRVHYATKQMKMLMKVKSEL